MIFYFDTAEEITNTIPMALITKDARENYFIIGAKEKPYPIVEITKTVTAESIVNNVKLTFTRRKSLISCSI